MLNQKRYYYTVFTFHFICYLYLVYIIKFFLNLYNSKLKVLSYINIILIETR